MGGKVIQRAIAKTLVFDTADVIKLLRKHGVTVSNDITYKQLLEKYVIAGYVNTAFLDDFTTLMIKRKRIADYNSQYHNVVGLGAAIIGGLASIAGGIFGSKQQDKSVELAKEQMEAANTQTIMNMMLQEDANKVALAKQENMLVISAVGAMVLITGIIILRTKK